MVVLGKPNKARVGSSSPRLPSTLSVPITPLASFVQAYCDSFVKRDPPMIAIRFGSVR